MGSQFRLGFRSHLHGRLPSPFTLLAAVAERTRRIRPGTAVVTLPLEEPIPGGPALAWRPEAR